MRSAALFTLLLSSLCAVAFGYGWSKEDHEIFRLRDELELFEGEGVTFYDFVGIKNGPAATQDDINKAYRKTSARLHPDKFKVDKTQTRPQQVAARKRASERFARLGLIANILRGENRERYDHFLKNGFPKWRGTGYYYARFRPGIGTVLFGLYVFAGAAHYVILRLNSDSQKKYMRNVIREAQQAAFGPSGIPGIDLAVGEDSAAAVVSAKSRKERRRRGGDSPSGPVTPQIRRKVTQPTGKSFIVDSNGAVFLLVEAEDGVEELLLDPAEISSARWKDTLLFSLPRGIWNLTLGRFVGKKAADVEEEDEEEVESSAAEAVESSADESPATAKKKVPKKLVRSGEGMPRRRVKGRVPLKTPQK